jgi:hypothetical protein
VEETLKSVRSEDLRLEVAKVERKLGLLVELKFGTKWNIE